MDNHLKSDDIFKKNNEAIIPYKRLEIIVDSNGIKYAGSNINNQFDGNPIDYGYFSGKFINGDFKQNAANSVSEEMLNNLIKNNYISNDLDMFALEDHPQFNRSGHIKYHFDKPIFIIPKLGIKGKKVVEIYTNHNDDFLDKIVQFSDSSKYENSFFSAKPQEINERNKFMNSLLYKMIILAYENNPDDKKK